LQSGGDFLALKLFLNAKCSGLIHKLWTAQGWPVHGSVVDSTVADGQSSPEPGLAVAPGRGDLPRGGKMERTMRGIRGTAHRTLDDGEEAAYRRWSFGSKWRQHGRGRG
jgi:hypothetical protein